MGSEREDTQAVSSFFQGWLRYWKAVDENYMGHREVYARLNRFLKENHPEPFSLLDCGCGDSSYMVKGLAGTAIAHYTGVDISENALNLARQNLEGLGFSLELISGDYAELITTLPIEPDIIWIGLSLHHLSRENKGAFLRECRKHLKHNHCHMLFFEELAREGESREAYLDRWWTFCESDWTVMGEGDKQSFREYAMTSDFPEPLSKYQSLARDAGFHGADLLLTTSRDLLGMMVLRPVP